MEILFFFLLLTTNCCNFFDDCFSRQEVVPISVKSLDGEAALRGQSCAMGVGLFAAQWWRGGGGSKRLILWLPRWEFTWDVQNVGNILASVCRSKLFFRYLQQGLCCPPEDKLGNQLAVVFAAVLRLIAASLFDALQNENEIQIKKSVVRSGFQFQFYHVPERKYSFRSRQDNCVRVRLIHNKK